MPPLLRLVPIASILILLCAPAFGQTILVSQTELNFVALPGGVSAVQTLIVASTAGNVPFTATFTPVAGGNFLSFSQTGGNLPANILLSASSATLGQGIFTGTFTITAPGALNSPLHLPVTLNVGVAGPQSIALNPQSLTFVGELGGANPPTQVLGVNTLGGPVSFTASISAPSSAGWLLVTPGSGIAPTTLQVSVNTNALTAGTYTAGITFNPAVGPPIVVPVTLNVGGNATLQLSNSTLQFYYQVGGLFPDAQSVTFTNAAAATPVNFTLTPTTSVGNWLFVTPQTASTPRSVAIAANPNGLPPGTYTGNIAVITPNVQGPIRNIAITLTIGATPLLTLSTPPAPFDIQTGLPVPGPRTVQIGSTGAPLSYTATAAAAGGNWLAIGPASGTTPQTLTVGVNPAGLAPGAYNGVVTVTSPGASNSPQSFNVTLNVNTTPVVSVSPSSLLFSYQLGTGLTVNTQTVSVTSGLANVPINVTTTPNNCGNWIQIFQNSATTPAVISVGVNASALALQQVCTGTLNIQSGSGAGLIQVPITLNVSANPLLIASPLNLSFTAAFDAQVVDSKTIALVATNGGALSYIAGATTNSGGPWLSAAPALGNTPTNLIVSVYSYGLSPGTYTGAVTISSPGLAAPLTIPVRLTVTAITTTIVNPTALSFTAAQGGSIPASQPITVTTTGGSNSFTATPQTVGGLGWLQVTPAGGNTPGTVNVSVNANGLSRGAYGGSIVFDVPGSSNNPLVVPVTLTVVEAAGITYSPASLNFTYVLGTVTNPGNQSITVGSTGNLVNFTASATTITGGRNWLSVAPAASPTPATVSASVNPSGLAVGAYNGQVSIVAPGALGSPIVVPVTLTIQPVPGTAITALSNAASGGRGAFAVGEIVTVTGTTLGPNAPVIFAPSDQGLVDTLLGGTRLFFDGFAAPILYTSQLQVNAIVPYEVAGRQVVQLQAEYQGQRSQSVAISLTPTAPGIFTTNSSGTGQGAILNQDSTINSSANRAGKGAVIQIFATGEGQTTPPGITGLITGTEFRKPVADVTATVGGIPAEITYAGAAPNSVLGLLQVNVKIPESAPSGPGVPVVIVIGGASSQGSVTVAIL